MQVARHTGPEGMGYNQLFSPGAVATYSWGRYRATPFTVHTDVHCRLGYHPLEAWLVEQKALPLQFYEAIMVKCLA